MDIQDQDYYRANSFVYKKLDDMAWKKTQEKNWGNL